MDEANFAAPVSSNIASQAMQQPSPLDGTAEFLRHTETCSLFETVPSHWVQTGVEPAKCKSAFVFAKDRPFRCLNCKYAVQNKKISIIYVII
ncbi:hypothetical protein [Paenibacillus apiarius]|uniref:hypothetical protein n=1 Tax=Paenibacillus apiarius TaxID=46240 RepID=UPI001980A278|nr:hypothetical protein [Paenibacillus apiarius]MBN3522470.1 hypothetical protein [Paenibacillus apiarius]